MSQVSSTEDGRHIKQHLQKTSLADIIPSHYKSLSFTFPQFFALHFPPPCGLLFLSSFFKTSGDRQSENHRLHNLLGAPCSPAPQPFFLFQKLPGKRTVMIFHYFFYIRKNTLSSLFFSLFRTSTAR
uniref:Uncharacterized protein n=1 Tax=Trypanosoma congolense (strain IL3000) TaxID=1068625 RepID=G0UMZ5_TRYCI|nr:hypothetical protein, unlikely [Trypanosoma congolense IL3000]